MAMLVSRTQKESIKLFVGNESGFVGFNWSSILDVPKIMCFANESPEFLAVCICSNVIDWDIFYIRIRSLESGS